MIEWRFQARKNEMKEKKKNENTSLNSINSCSYASPNLFLFYFFCFKKERNVYKCLIFSIFVY